MKKSFDSLIESVGVIGFPERFRLIYDEAMADYEKNGCPYIDPAFYDKVKNKYNILSDCVDVYKNAAVEIRKNEDYTRFLHLLCFALRDEEYNFSDTAALKMPYTKDEEPYAPLDMLTGLAMCSQIDSAAKKLEGRNLPKEVHEGILNRPEKGLFVYRMYHGGKDGYDLINWYQRTVTATLIPIKRLEMEVFASFTGFACIFKSNDGRIVSLADNFSLHRDGFALGARNYTDETGSWVAEIEETDTEWIGHPFDERGFVKKERVSLKKGEWELVLKRGDPVVQLHIPASGKLTPELVEESIQAMRDFIAEYYPDFKYKAFACGSWLLNPILEDMLGADSNIVKFGKLFTPLTMKASGTSIFSFAFHAPDGVNNLEALPEDTKLRKLAKDYYLKGGAIHETLGFFF
ncbi:MAG: hypothetical protein IIW20_02150 [Clostridia bacterium]|nr:hypothetical protein [Clostridia bacterium]